MAGDGFTVSVPGIGDFVFRRRAIRDQLRIEAEARRILGGPTDDDTLHGLALQMATLGALTLNTPEGWDLEDLDPLDPTAILQITEVHRALREEEDRFRRPTGA